MPTTYETVLAVFSDRDVLEKAIQALLTQGFNQAQVSLLTTDATIQELKGQRTLPADQTTEAVDRSETGNVQGILAGIPAYLAGALAAGVTVASGGALAGVALAALGGVAGGGLLGAGAAGVFKGNIDARYEEQLAQGGIVVVVSPKDAAQIEDARRILTANGADRVDTTSFENAPTKAEDDPASQKATGPVVDASSWTGG